MGRFIEKLGKVIGSGIAPQRSLRGFSLRVLQGGGFLFAAFFLYGAVNGASVFFGPRHLSPFRIDFPFLPLYNDHFTLPLFYFFTSVLIFLVYPASESSPKERPSAGDWMWCLASLGILLDYVYFFEFRGEMTGAAARWNDILFGALATLIALESCRRVLGNLLPALALLFVIYDWDWVGPYFPGEFLPHKGQSLVEVLVMSYGPEGIYGIVTRTYANMVFLFVLFGAFLQFTKVGDVFVDLAFALVGRARGGPAKAAVVSSCLVGSVVGSGAANVVITGTFTIPMMKRAGYKPEFAGAVEAVASIGGHLMPPIMGSGAFLMAALTNTSYSYIAFISFVPALLYYFSIFMQVHFHASHHNLGGMRREDLPDFWAILRRDGLMLLPIVPLVVLLILQFSPFYAAFWSLAAAVVCYTFKREQWLVLALEAAVFAAALAWGEGFFLYLGIALAACLSREPSRRFVGEIAQTFVEGSKGSLVIGATAGVSGIVLAGMAHSGLGLKLPELILSYSYGYLSLALLLTAIASYILGMGMTILASYILIIILAGPALQELGVPLLATHLIVYWLSQDAAFSPPFALGAFVAAGISGGDPMLTGFNSLRLAKPLYLVTIMMAYVPAFLMTPGTSWVDTLVSWASTTLAFVCTAAALEGFLLRRLNWGDRFLLIAAGILFMVYAPVANPALYWTKAAGLLLLGGSLHLQRLRPMGVVPREAPRGAVT